jgi:hypothetical protein
MRLLPVLVSLLALACTPDYSTLYCTPSSTPYESPVGDGGTEMDGGSGADCIELCGPYALGCSTIHPCDAGIGDCVTCTLVSYCE